MFHKQHRQPTREETRAAYEAVLKEIMARADVLDAETMVALQALVIDLQERVLARIASELTAGGAEKSWGAWWIPRLIRALDDVLAEASRKAGGVLGAALADSWQIGSDLVERPIRVVRPDTLNLQPAIDLTTMTTVAPFSARLITAISETTQSVVDRAIRTSVALGETPFSLMQALAKSPLDRGPWKTLAYRTEIIARTEIARVQTVAAEARLQQVSIAHPGLLQGPNGLKQIFTSTQIGPWPCKVCAPLDGTVWAIDDPKKPVPPMHPNCFPGYVKAAPLGELEAVFRRPYDGPMVEIFVAGSETALLTVTPNHPVLTGRGWVPAGELNELDQLVRYRGIEPDASTGGESLDHADVNDPEASFEEIFGALADSGLVERMIDAPVNFHGDGQAEEVEIVWTDGGLRSRLETSLLEGLSDSSLAKPDTLLDELRADGALLKGFRCVTCGGEGSPLLGSHPLQPQDVSLRSTAPLDPRLPQGSGDHSTGDLQAEGYLQFRDPFLVQADDLGILVRVAKASLDAVLLEDALDDPARTAELGAGLLDRVPRLVESDNLGRHLVVPGSPGRTSATDGDSLLNQEASQPFFGCSEASGDLVDWFAHQVTLLDVVRVERFSYSGHVYTLQTSRGYYTASAGVVVKNCRCLLSPFFPGISRVRSAPAPTAERQRKASVAESCGCCGGYRRPRPARR